MAEIDERQLNEQKEQLKDALILLYDTINKANIERLNSSRRYYRLSLLFAEWISNMYDIIKLTRDSQIILRLDEKLLSLDTSNFHHYVSPTFSNPIINLFHDYLDSDYDSSNLKDKVKYIADVSCCHNKILVTIHTLTIFYGKIKKTNI